MKKLTKTNFIEWNNNVFIASIKKINFNIILIIILDSLFYLLSGYFVIFWLQRIQTKIATFNLPADISSIGYEKAQQLVGGVRVFYYLIIFSFVLLLIAIIFLASISKGIIWAKTTNTKITLKLISKFFLLNLLWMGFWFILVISISLFIEPASVLKFMIAAIILGLYFTNTLYSIFMKKHMFNSIIEAVKINVTKIHLLAVPYTAVFILFYVTSKLNSLIQYKYSFIAFAFILLIYTAFIRYYVSTIVYEINL